MKSKRVALIGALWIDNFGDVLLADFFKNQVESLGYEAVFPFCNGKLLKKYGWKGGGWKYFLSSKKVVFFGGGYLSTPNEASLKWTVKRFWSIHQYAEWCRILRKPYAILGAGLGPIYGSLAKIAIKRVVSGAQLVGLRDTESVNESIKLLGGKNNKVIETADYAIANIVSSYKKRVNEEKIKIGIHSTKEFHNIISSFEKVLSNTKAKIEFNIIYDQVNQPSPLKNEVINFCKENGFGYNEINYVDAYSLIEHISSLSAVVTNKLHVGIVASSMKIPVISIPSHSKVTRYYGQIGKKEFCLFNKNYTKEILSDLIEKAIFCTHGYYIPDKVIQRSILNNDLLQKFLFRF